MTTEESDIKERLRSISDQLMNEENERIERAIPVKEDPLVQRMLVEEEVRRP